MPLLAELEVIVRLGGYNYGAPMALGKWLATASMFFRILKLLKQLLLTWFAGHPAEAGC